MKISTMDLKKLVKLADSAEDFNFDKVKGKFEFWDAKMHPLKKYIGGRTFEDYVFSMESFFWAEGGATQYSGSSNAILMFDENLEECAVYNFRDLANFTKDSEDVLEEGAFFHFLKGIINSPLGDKLHLKDLIGDSDAYRKCLLALRSVDLETSAEEYMLNSMAEEILKQDIHGVWVEPERVYYINYEAGLMAFALTGDPVEDLLNCPVPDSYEPCSIEDLDKDIARRIRTACKKSSEVKKELDEWIYDL